MQSILHDVRETFCGLGYADLSESDIQEIAINMVEYIAFIQDWVKRSKDYAN